MKKKKKKKKQEEMFVGRVQEFHRLDMYGTWESRRLRVRNKIDLLIRKNFFAFTAAVGHEPEEGQEIFIVEPVLYKVWSYGVNIADDEVYARYERLLPGLKNGYRTAVQNGSMPEFEICRERYRLVEGYDIQPDDLRLEGSYGQFTADHMLLFVPMDEQEEEPAWIKLRYGIGENGQLRTLFRKLAVLIDQIHCVLITEENDGVLFLPEEKVTFCVRLLLKAGCSVLDSPEEVQELPEEAFETDFLQE